MEYPPPAEQRFAAMLTEIRKRLARLEAAATANTAKAITLASYASTPVITGQASIATGDLYTDVTLPAPTVVDYTLTATPQWDTTYWVTDHTDTGCRIWWDTPSASDLTIRWTRTLLGSWGQISFTDITSLELLTAGCALNFTPILVPNWNTTWSVSEIYGTGQFTANFGTAAPANAAIYSTSVVGSATPGAVGSIVIAGIDYIAETDVTATCGGTWGYAPLVVPSWDTTWWVDYANYPTLLDINFGTAPDADSDVAVTLIGNGPS